ncbi:phosphodiester glycosidase family protein [Streptomyces sp. NBC_00878]|uniref:phosphodiester glycosidase family protein n=1 Tax=Streptomyces sp. NBC_00878 TaxID=2975854 RepID=UPI00338EED45
MRSLGAVQALNLDGGGSTAMAVRGTLANNPSDATGERAVGDTVQVLPPSAD